MGYDEQRQPLVSPCQGVDRMVDLLLGGAIQGRGRFVEQQQIGLPIEGTGDADALPLTTRQATTALSDRGIYTARQRVDQLAELCVAQGLFDARSIHLLRSNARGYILGKGAIDQKEALRYITHALLPTFAILFVERNAVDRNLALCREIEPREQVE